VSFPWFEYGRCNVLIPNPEWYFEQYWRFLRLFDLILCKTRHATSIYQGTAGEVVYIGWTSEDRYAPGLKNNSEWLHIAGSSLHKGTGLVVRTWKVNARFPRLTIVQSPKIDMGSAEAENVNWVRRFLPDDELKRLQNMCGVHVCPSETEGFGHYINEGLSVGSVVITTEAPPMNELVPGSTGVLARYVAMAPQRMAMRYFCSEETLAEAVNTVLAISPEELERRQQNARHVFFARDILFHQRFTEVIAKIEQEVGRRPAKSEVVGQNCPES